MTHHERSNISPTSPFHITGSTMRNSRSTRPSWGRPSRSSWWPRPRETAPSRNWRTTLPWPPASPTRSVCLSISQSFHWFHGSFHEQGQVQTHWHIEVTIIRCYMLIFNIPWWVCLPFLKRLTSVVSQCLLTKRALRCGMSSCCSSNNSDDSLEGLYRSSSLMVCRRKTGSGQLWRRMKNCW